jgi:sigma-B regulation protein RsbU (phosphoserine phosphatase)
MDTEDRVHTILIADDNPDMIYLIKKRFEKGSYNFIEARDGDAALQKVRDERPDLVLLDLKMPGKTGMEVLEELKGDFELKDIPVIVLTVVDDTQEKIRALEKGASDFLVKPPEPTELRARVNTQLRLLKASNLFKRYSEHLENLVSKKLRELKAYSGRLEEMVDEKVGLIKRQNQELLVSLNAARKVQNSLLPAATFRVEGVSFESFYFPCEAVGGDFFDIFRIDEDHIGFFIADVSGHGLPSAMITIFLKREVFYHAKQVFGKGKYRVSKPKEVLSRLNQSFIENNIGEGKYFVTMIYATYSLQRRTVTLSVAGHHALPLLRKKNGEVEEVRMCGFPIGWFDNVGEYPETQLILSPDDSVLLYTDGIFELFQDGLDFSSFDQMIASVASLLKKGTFQEWVNKSRNRYSKENKKACDDITFILMKIAY